MAQHTPTTGPAPASISDLLEQFGGCWQIAYQIDLNVWSAERRSPDGRHVRFVAEHTVGALAARLAGAETEAL
jgi:hypothetical protein